MPTRRIAPAPEELHPYESDLEYLQDEMTWIETRCRRIALGRQQDTTSDDGFRARHRVEDGFEDIDGHLRERFEVAVKEENTLRRAIDARRMATRGAGRPLALDRLADTIGLDDFDRVVLLLAVAPCFDSRYQGAYGQILGSPRGGSTCTVEVAFTFAELPFADRVRRRRCFSSASPLMSNSAVSLGVNRRMTDPGDLLDAEIRPTPSIFDFVLGDEGLSDELMEFSSVEEPRSTLDQVVLPNDDKRRILALVRDHDRYLAARKAWGFDERIRYGRGAFILFTGAPGTGKTLTAHAIAHEMGRRVLTVDIPTFARSSEAGRFLPGLFREARLRNAVLFFDECETLFADRRTGNGLMTMLLTEIERYEGVAIAATNRAEVLDPALLRRILVQVHFRPPDRTARREIWRRHLPPEAPLANDVDVDRLARHDLSGGYIKNAVLVALAEAVHSGAVEPRISMEHLDRAAREQLAASVSGDSASRRPAGFRSSDDDEG